MKEAGGEGNLEPDILRMRAEARALLQDPDQGPTIITQYVGCLRDADGRLLGPNLNFNRAKVGARAFERGEHEPLADFEARVESELPAIGVGEARYWIEPESPRHSDGVSDTQTSAIGRSQSHATERPMTNNPMSREQV